MGDSSISGDNQVGGLAGFNIGTVQDSFATGTVSSDDDVGGLFGRNSSGTIQDSFATGTVNGNNNVGGLVGRNSSSTVQRVYCVISDTNCVGRNLDATVTSVFVVSLSTLRSRTCSNAVFRDSDGDDCDTAGMVNFLGIWARTASFRDQRPCRWAWCR